MSCWRAFCRLVLVISLVVFGGCATVSEPLTVQERPQVLLMVPVCNKPPELTSAQNMWAYSVTWRLVPSTDEAAFRAAVWHQGEFFTHEPNADPRNGVRMPLYHSTVPCPETNTKGPLVGPWRVHLIAGKIVPLAPPGPCKLLRKNALALFDPLPAGLRAELRSDERPAPVDGRWLAQPARMPPAKHPDPVRMAQDEARATAVNQSWESGNKFGSAIAGIESGLETLSSKCSLFEEDLRENPEILADIQQKIAKTLNDIPLPPEYTDRELKALAVIGFSRGFEHGFGAKKLQFLALNTSATLAILLTPNVYLAAETAAAKAVRLALERVRSIPIYVPAMTNGAGFFLKLPKPAPANMNAPSAPPVAPPRVVPPPPPPPPPFGNLSRAAQFGILTEAKMIKALAGTGLQRHHLIEQRFIGKMGDDPRMKLTVAVTDAEHQVFTNKWRDAIPYGAAGTHSERFKRAEIIKAAREIYKAYPAILKALDL